MSDISRRIHERFTCEMAIWFRPEAGDEDFHLVEITNISGGGILCLLHHEVSVGDQLDIRIELPQRSDMVRIKGVVRHLRKAGVDEWFSGIEFSEVQGMSVPAFLAYVEAMFI